MNRFLVLLMSLVLALPVQALDLQGLYEQALTASRQGDFVEALPLWDRFLEQAPEDAAALSNRGNVRLALGDASGADQRPERLDRSGAGGKRPASEPGHGGGGASGLVRGSGRLSLDSGARSAGCLSPLQPGQCAWLARGLA